MWGGGGGRRGAGSMLRQSGVCGGGGGGEKRGGVFAEAVRCVCVCVCVWGGLHSTVAVVHNAEREEDPLLGQSRRGRGCEGWGGVSLQFAMRKGLSPRSFCFFRGKEVFKRPVLV